MTASILMLIGNEELRAKLTGYLACDRFAVTEGAPLNSSSAVEETVSQIASASPNLVIMDYVGEDEASVKVLQNVSNSEPKTEFIFVDSHQQAERDKIMLAFNEGVRAFLPPDISSVALVNYVTRALEGPGRFRSDLSREESEIISRKVDSNLNRIRVHLDSAQKLISYLLSTPVSTQPRRVLVLSDSAYQRELLKKHLEDHNFVVLTASNVDEAVAVTLAEKPRIVISDYTLEDGQNGVDFCKALKFTHKFGPCYFVVCTASMEKISVIMTPGNGVDDCVLKPSPASSLNEFIASVAAGLLL
ncbi:MAG: response regulator [Deltaproteobacteria bacterium]|jgi:DNA-binding NarL/FixJ family response regulator|nr:response regulator [Deltaproteobacteria bacterium]